MGVKSSMFQQMIDRAHQEVHEGEMYGSAFFWNLTGGENKKLILLTGTKFPHYFFNVVANGPMLVKLYEDSYYSATAGPVTNINLNRAVADTCLMRCYSTPTITTDGTCIFSRFLVGQTGGGVGLGTPAQGSTIRPGTEMILDSGSTYHFYFENSAAAAIVMEFAHEFYEEDGVNG